jgi:putative ABC transport system permease protein
MNTFGQDIRYGARTLLRNPSFTVIAVLALALGIGMNTALFSVVKEVLLRPLPFEHPDRLVIIYGSNLQKGLTQSEIVPADFVDYREQNHSFENISALRYRDFTLTNAGEPEIIRGTMVSASFFSLLGVKPLLGRAFLFDEDRPGKDRIAVISHGLWQRLFGSDPSIIERSLTLNGESYSVTGVLPPDFDFPRASEQVSSPDLWVPLALTADDLRNRRNHVLLAVARLNPGSSREQAQAEMTVIARGLEQQYPQSNSGWSVNTVSLNEQIVGNSRPALLVLLGAVVLVLLIACANVANLLLVRGAGRQKEIALRIALGASRSRIIRQLLTESVLLAMTGGIVGVFLALGAVRVLTSLRPDYVPRANQIGIDGWMLAFTIMVSLLTGVLFGLAPALQASKPDLNETLKEGTKGASAGAGRNSARIAFVVSEVALSLMLLIGAGLLIRSFVRLLSVSPGFNGNNLLTMEINLPRAKYGQPHQQAAFFDQLVQRVAAIPGIQSVGGTNHLPLGGSNSSVSFTVKGHPPLGPGESAPTTNWRAVTPDYFRTMQIPLLSGRSFTESDRDGAPVVVVISDTMARRFWPDENAVGQQINLGGRRQCAGGFNCRDCRRC